MASKTSALKAAKAVNSLLGLSSGDQEDLLDVLQLSDDEHDFSEGQIHF